MPIRKFVAPDLGFGFAWEPESRNLTIIHDNGAPHEQVASGVQTPEIAELLVTLWCRGYRSKAREIERDPAKKYFHMLADGGKIGAKF